ncbi:MAG TPA: hypothetical protein VJR27_01765 [Candidatus Saccharimonadales bacterium]|nr:hypothetical protein [Candidatus Saccharimonadales bacterium]
MKLEDIDYFAAKKAQQPEVFNLAQKVVGDYSAKDPANHAEMQRRLAYLAKSTGNEHLRQCANFIAVAAQCYFASRDT